MSCAHSNASYTMLYCSNTSLKPTTTKKRHYDNKTTLDNETYAWQYIYFKLLIKQTVTHFDLLFIQIYTNSIIII